MQFSRDRRHKRYRALDEMADNEAADPEESAGEFPAAEDGVPE